MIDGAVKSAGAQQCLPRIESFDAAKQAVIAALVRAAIATRPGCTMDEAKPADALTKCFK